MGLGLVLTAVALVAPRPDPGIETSVEARPGPDASVGHLPLSFEPNVGQVPDRYDFVARGQGFGMALDATGATLSVGAARAPDFLRLRFRGADRSAGHVALEPLPGEINYLVGDDPSAWQRHVPTFARVSYTDVLPGVDVTYYGTGDGTLEYDLVVAPHADPSSVRLGFPGASSIEIRDGSLVLATSRGVVTQAPPVLHQTIAGRRVPVEGGFEVVGRDIAFAVGAYDARHPLVIDPTITYSTYLGGGHDEEGHGIAVNDAGETYVTGVSYSTNFPTRSPFGPTGVLQASNGQGAGGTSGADVFVSKLNAAGTALVYSTYLGGSGADIGTAIAIDGSGQAHVTGSTGSTNFPTQSAWQGALAQGAGAGGPPATDAFVAKLNAVGSALLYSTYLGGSDVDIAHGIALDRAGRAHVTGSTFSSDFPSQSPIQPAMGGSGDAFVTRLATTGAALDYSTYLGGAGADHAYGIAVEPTGTAYVTGYTASADFPTQGPFQATRAGAFNAFVTKINDKGTALVYSTYLGGSGTDVAYGVAIDGSGAAYVAGHTTSTDFPLQAPIQPVSAGVVDAFVTKLSPAGSALVYSTYLGGSDSDFARAIAVNGSGAAFVTGDTFSGNLPTRSPLQASKPFDAFVTNIDPTGTNLVYSTYLGGAGGDIGYGIAVGDDGAYVTGTTSSTDFPTAVPLQAANAGARDAFVTKLFVASTTAADLSLTKTDSPDPVNAGQPLTYTITVHNAGPATATGVTVTDTLPSGVTFGSASPGCTQASGTVTCALANLAAATSAQVVVVVVPGQAGVVTNIASVTANQADPVLADNQDDERTTVLAALLPCDGTAAASVVTIQVTAANQTTYGTSGNDVIRGTNGADVIDGLGGDDIICGLGGDDTIAGGDGADRLYGDSVYGGTGADQVSGGPGSDRIHGNLGADLLYGDAGGDKVLGDDGADLVSGGAGDDELSGFAGDDKLLGGTGRDTLSGGDGKDFLNGGGADDKLYGNPGDDKLFGGAGHDWLYGESFSPNGTGNDFLNGGAGNDRLYGAPGNDTLHGLAGGDNLQGGDGDDALDGGAQSDVCDGGAGGDSGSNCEPFTQ